MIKYEKEILDEDEDNGTMVGNVEEFEHAIIGHKIVKAEYEDHEDEYYWYNGKFFTITLDNGKKVTLIPDGDCCAYTDLESFLLNVELVDHIIMGVGTTGGYTTWHIFCDFGDIMQLKVGWSCGNPFYYGYGFNIKVKDAE